jgi:hypothetical protein
MREIAGPLEGVVIVFDRVLSQLLLPHKAWSRRRFSRSADTLYPSRYPGEPVECGQAGRAL